MAKRCLSIMAREVFYMWRDRGLRIILLAVPVLSLLLFYGIYSAQVIKDIPAAVVDLDRSSASRNLIENFRHAEYLKIVAFLDSYEEAEDLIKSGKAVVAIVIPENYEKNVALNRQSRVLVAIDGSNMIYATNATSAALAVTRTISAQSGIKSLVARGISLEQAQDAYEEIQFREEPWFNPTLNYAYFLVLGLALNIWQQCCTLAACMNVIGETGFKSWYQIRASGISRFKLFFCKSTVHIITFLLMAMPVYFLAFIVFKLPLSSSFWTVLLFTLVFAVAIHSIGTLMSGFSRSAVDSSRFGMIVALPSFILSGYTWPLEAMPHYLQKIAKILPQTWFFQGINYLMFKTPDFAFLSHFFLPMSVTAVVCYGVAAIFISRS